VTEPFLGQIMVAGFNFAPRGWALCNGQTLSIQQNAALFSLLGTTYGGNGTTTYALPNLQSRVPVHKGSYLGTDYVQGEAAGEETVTLNSTQIPSHTHTVSVAASADERTTDRPDGAYPTVGGLYAASPDSNAPMGSSPTSATGGSQPHTNLQPYLTVNFVIALAGVFPSRN
jgi:microcystin-dependent protein